MRAGRVFKRCSRSICGAKVPDKRCPRCGGDRWSWAYVVDVNPPGAKRKQVRRGGFATRKEALAALAELQVDRSRGQHVEPSKQTVGEYLAEWLAAVRPNYRPGAWDAMECHVRCYIAPRIGDVPLQQLTTTGVKAFLADLEANGRQRGDRPLSRKTVHNVYRTLCKALNDACDESPPRLLRNPAAKAHKAPEQREAPSWTVEELRQFFLHEVLDRWLALWRLAAYTGMRRGELAGLRWPDVDLDAGRVRLYEQRAKGGGTVTRERLKGKRGRSLALDPATVAALKAWRKRLTAEQLAWPGEWGNDEQLVFTHEDGTPLHPDSITKTFKRRVDAAGAWDDLWDHTCPKCGRTKDAHGLPLLRGPHGLRHTYASLALEAGENIKLVSARLGHASIAITGDVYAHVTPEVDEAAASRVAAILDGDGGGQAAEDAEG